MKLYFHPLSGNSRRVLLVVEHLGLAVERAVIDLTRGEQRSDDHRQRNPNGRVPVLDDGGFLLWESNAIIQYLADRTPGQTVYPTDPRDRADVNRWLFWNTAHMAVACAVLMQENFVKPLMGRPGDAAELARGEALFAQHAQVLDAHLAGKTWIAQDRLTLADFSLGATFSTAIPARLPLADYPNLRAWLGRMRELPAWQRTEPPPPPGRG